VFFAIENVGGRVYTPPVWPWVLVCRCPGSTRSQPANPTPHRAGGKPRPLQMQSNRCARPCRRKGDNGSQLAPRKIAGASETKRRSKRIYAPLNLVSVRKIFVVCFVQLPEILIEPLFRLEQVPKRTKFKGRAEFARGDANRGHRGRVDWFAIAQRLTRRPYDRNGNGGAERRAGLQGRPQRQT
jgi:hypothetical protein